MIQNLRGDLGPVLGRALVAALSAGCLSLVLVISGCGQAVKSQERPVVNPTVTAVKVERRTVPLEAEINGVTRALQSVTLRARVKGFLQEAPLSLGQSPVTGPGPHVTIREGTTVQGPRAVDGKMVPGDLVFLIEEAPYIAANDAATANREAARAELLKAEKSKIRETSEAQVALDRAKSELAKVEEKRRLILYQRQASPKEEVDEYQARRIVSDEQVKASEAQLEQAKSDFETTIAAARSTVSKAAAEVENSELQLSYCRVQAPISGRLGEARVKVGNLVGPMTSASQDTDLATIEQLDPMGVDFRPSSMYQDRTTALLERGGVAVRLFVHGNQLFPHEGRTFFMDNTIDQTTSTYLVKASVANPDGKLLPGEYVRVRAVLGEFPDALVVPSQAVIDGGQIGNYVYVIAAPSAKGAEAGAAAQSAGTVAQRVLVQVLEEYRGLKVIRTGLEPGQLVVVEGLQMIARPGQPVEVEERPFDEMVRIPGVMETTLDQDLIREGIIRFPGAAASPAPSTPSAPAAAQP